MTPVGELIFDIFESLCDSSLSESEARLLKQCCGLRTGYPPMSVPELAFKYGKPNATIRKFAFRALVKLPHGEMERLKAYLQDRHHPYHQSLTLQQRDALRQLVDYALELQQMRMKQTVPKATPTPVVTPVARPPTTLPSFQAKVSITERLAAALEQLARPSHYENIHAQASWDGEPVSVSKAFYVMTNSRDFVMLGGGVFALQCWRNRVNGISPARLLYCPPLPIPERARADRLLELIVMIRGWLRESPLTVGELWTWLMQNVPMFAQPQDVFDLWYAVDLFPSVDYSLSRNRMIQMTMPPDLDVNDIRHHALDALVQRIDRMSNVLAAVAEQRQPSIQQISAVVYRDARDGADIQDRLRALEALGALRDEKGWQITRQGLAVLEAHPATNIPSPVWEDDEATFDLDLGFLEL